MHIFSSKHYTATLGVFFKLRHHEKATKLEKNLQPVLTKQLFYSVVSKQVGDFFKFLCLFQKSWALIKESLQVVLNSMLLSVFSSKKLQHFIDICYLESAAFR